MQSFSFAPNNYGQRENQKSARPSPLKNVKPNGFSDYVFVDEHNRHKRLKGMFIKHLRSVDTNGA